MAISETSVQHDTKQVILEMFFPANT